MKRTGHQKFFSIAENNLWIVLLCFSRAVIFLSFLFCASNASAQCLLNLTSQPQNQADCNGNQIKFAVTIGSGAPPYTYTWYYKRTTDPSFSILSTTANVSTFSHTLTVANIGNATAPDGTQYYVEVTDANNCSVTSGTATLTVNEITGIKPSTRNISICQGGSYTLTANTTGSVASYQWTLNGNDIPGDTSSTLNITNANSENNGFYKIRVVFNVAGAAVSTCQRTSQLTRNLTVIATGIVGSSTVCANSSENIYKTEDGKTNYAWSVTGGTINSGTGTSSVSITWGSSGNGTISASYTDPTVACTTTPASLNVTINPLPTISGTLNVCTGLTTVLSASDIPASSNSWTSSNAAVATVNSSGVVSGNAAGTSSIIYTNNKGCRQTATVNVNPSPALSFTSTDISCNGGNNGSATVNVSSGTSPFAYNWSNGATSQTINNLPSGTYTVTVTDSKNCSANADVTITQPASTLSAMASGTNVSCNGGNNGTATVNINGGTSPYTYNWSNGGVTSTINNLTAGAYTVTIKDANNCSYAASVTIKEPEALTATFTQTNVLCNGASTGSVVITPAGGAMPYNITPAQTNLAAGNYTFTVTDANGCSIQVPVIIIQPASIINSTATKTVCSNQLPFTWNGQSYSSAGSYDVTLKSTKGCDSVVTLNLAVNSVPTSTTNISVCSNQLPYVWNGQSYNAGGLYQITLQTQAGCDSIAKLNLNVTSVLTSTISISICNNRLPYNWNGQLYNAAGSYSVTLRSSSGCDSIATLNLVVNSTQTSTTSIDVCPKQLPFTWNGQSYSSAGSYNVTLKTAAGCDSIATLNLTLVPTIKGPVDSTTVCANVLPVQWNGITITTSGTYAKTLQNAAGCDSIATVAVTVTSLTTATISGGNAICAGASTAISIALTGNAPWTIVYSDGSGSYAISGITSSPYFLTVSPAITTTYSMQSVADVKCVNTSLNSSVTVVVTQSALPGIRYQTVTATANLAKQLSARDLGSGSKYNWSPSTGLNYTDVRTPIFKYDKPIEYLITITPANGCRVADTLQVLIASPPFLKSSLLMPGAWTPNNDGHNDRLYPLTAGIKELYYFRVYNRWGQLLFETNKNGEGWDGLFNGKPQPVGVYVWVVKALGTDGVYYQKSGTAVLIR